MHLDNNVRHVPACSALRCGCDDGAVIADRTSFADVFAHAPALNPSRARSTGVVCGVRVEQIEEQPMREIRYLDKLVDELAKGKAMGKILRG